MDRDQFKKKLLALQGKMGDIGIVEESNKKGDEADDGEKEVYKSTLNICDLPIVLLWETMESLDGNDLLSIAGAHENILHATKHLKDKHFHYVDCVASIGMASSQYSLTPDVLEILLHGAHVDHLEFDSTARPFTVDGLKLSTLYLCDPQQDDKAAIFIEKLKPETVDRDIYGGYTMSPRLCQALSKTRRIFLGDVGMELLDFLLQWKGRLLHCTMDISNPEKSSRFFDTITQFLDERRNGVPAPFRLLVRFRPRLLADQLHRNLLGPDYPLLYDRLDRSYCSLRNPFGSIRIRASAVFCQLS